MRNKLCIPHQTENILFIMNMCIHKKQGGMHQKAEATQEKLGSISLSCTEEQTTAAKEWGRRGWGAEAGGRAKLEFTFRLITHSLLVLTQPCSHLNFVVVNHDCQLGKIERHLGD